MSSGVVHVDFKKAAKPQLRTFTNPPIKQEIPADFPDIVTGSRLNQLADLLSERLKKFGIDNIADVGTIHVAYPHKHPVLYPTHINSASEGAVTEIVRSLKKTCAGMKFRPAKEICETIKLGRSFNQSVIHALTGRQVYEIYIKKGAKAPSYLNGAARKKNFFIVADHCSEQGTTLTNLMSYIHYNGGVVLAAVVSDVAYGPILQRTDGLNRKFSLSSPFNDAARNTGRLKQLAEVFAREQKSIGKRLSPQKCMEQFEAALNACDNTVFALTEVECRVLMNNNFSYFLEQLHTHAKSVTSASAKKIACNA